MLTLVEWPCVTIQTPRIRHSDLLSPVEDRRREHSSFEERSVELDVEHKVETRVDVCTAIIKNKVSERIVEQRVE